MLLFIYRCPLTGRNVQGFVAEEAAKAADDKTYESVNCTACSRLHLVNPKTGAVVGGERR
jgi:hypothetical protein